MAEVAEGAGPLRVVARSTFVETVVVAAVAGFIAGLGSYSILFVH